LLDITSENALSCLDKDGTEQQFNIDIESEIFKKLKEEFDSGKTLIVTVVKAPVETAKDKFKDEEMVESFKEDKSEGQE